MKIHCNHYKLTDNQTFVILDNKTRSLGDAVRLVILQAGALAKDYFQNQANLAVSLKNPKDLVTEADIRVENFIRDQLTSLYPQYGFWGEESGKPDNLDQFWVVDPIDGTHSFYRGQYFWSISIALQIGSDITVGAVYAPALDDLYFSEKDGGSTKNGKPIRVSQTNNLAEAMVCTGFACLRSNLKNNNLERFSRIALKTRDQRRYGSAALDLCMVADGQLDAFWEQNLNLYDVAAGALIAKEAGASVSDFSGREGMFPENILVTNGRIKDRMVELM